jgi:hypothetical protein
MLTVVTLLVANLIHRRDDAVDADFIAAFASTFEFHQPK